MIMHNLTNEFFNSLKAEVTTMATCWHLKLKNGVELGFCDFDEDIIYNELIYKASSGFNASAVVSKSSLAIDNLEIEGMIDNNVISEKDIISGVYDHAEIEIFMVDYLNLSAGKMVIKKGWLGEINICDGKFIVEIRGLSQKASKTTGELFTPYCRANLGDARCKIDLAKYSYETEVIRVLDNRNFAIKNEWQNFYFNNGVVEFLSGACIGMKMEIKNYAAGDVELYLEMMSEIKSQDRVKITAGCDKTVSCCSKRFNNILNFRGEPHIPSGDTLIP
jgi:uncharacterized phage protein (TIGR02218 family)